MRGMTGRSVRLRGAGVSPAEALRGLVAFLLLAATLAGVAAGLLYAGERPGPPPALPRWEDVAHALGAAEPPLPALRYGVSMAGWLVLTYVAAVLLMRALAGTLVALTRGAAWAHDLERLVDLATIPWVRRGVSGGLMAALLVASLVKVSPELPRLSPGGDEGVARAAAPATAAAAGGGESVVVTATTQEAAIGPGVEGAAAEASSGADDGVSGVASSGLEAAAAPAAGEAAAEGQGRVRPELPAPVVVLPGQERRDGGDVPGGGEEAPPEGVSQQGPGVRLPGQAGR